MGRVRGRVFYGLVLGLAAMPARARWLFKRSREARVYLHFCFPIFAHLALRGACTSL
ncbi:hypothetical protein T492DRAFT_1023687, partial [Pavlovales sp. CCMP2436]